VFILNEFLTGIGGAVTEQHGRIDKFSSDSLLAVFGERDGLDAGCRQALRAARAIDLAMDRLNEKLAADRSVAPSRRRLAFTPARLFSAGSDMARQPS
jgi:adenylate cyclase